MKQIAQLLGIYIETDFYIPIVLRDLDNKDYTISTRLLSNVTNTLAYMLQNETEATMESHLEYLIDLVCRLENTYSDNAAMLTATFRLIFSLVHAAKGLMNKVISKIFSALLTIQSSEITTSTIKKRCAVTIQYLAENTGYKSVSELYSQEVELILQGYTQTKSYEKWNKYSKERFKFGLIVTETKGELRHLIEHVLEIMEQCIKNDKDYEVR